MPVIPATVQPTDLTLSLPNGLEIRGIEANNLGLVRDLLSAGDAGMKYRVRPHPRMPQIYLYRDPVDFRKSFRGLAAIVEQELGHNPFEGVLYAFTNRRRDKIKLLYWEDNGFVLYYKSLAEEKFHWPGGEEELVSLTGQQINWLLDGYDIGAMKGHRKLQYEATF